MENVPGRSLGQTPSGGRGYVDAYGNSLDDQPPLEKKIVKRRLDSLDSSTEKEKSRPLPEPRQTTPLWKF